MSHTLEKHMRIYNDVDGSFIEVRPDADALGLIEVNYAPDADAKRHGLILKREEAELLIEALQEVLKNNPNIT